MSRRAARFTQAELGRAFREAAKAGMRVVIRDGEIHFVEASEQPSRIVPVEQRPRIVL